MYEDFNGSGVREAGSDRDELDSVQSSGHQGAQQGNGLSRPASSSDEFDPPPLSGRHVQLRAVTTDDYRFLQLPSRMSPAGIRYEARLVEDLGLDSLALVELASFVIDSHKESATNDELLLSAWNGLTVGQLFERIYPRRVGVDTEVPNSGGR